MNENIHNSGPVVYRGALVSPEDPSDLIFESIANAGPGTENDVPETYDLRVHTRTPRNQGSRGTCAAFTGALIREIQCSMANNASPPLSPEFIYYHRESIGVEGMCGKNVFQILQAVGVAPEEMCPYEESDRLDPPSLNAYSSAQEYRISEYVKVTTPAGLKRAILEYGPCYVLLPVYSTRPFFWRKPLGSTETAGGHAVAAVGFNEEGFIFQNSWGSDWNNDGSIILPYNEWPFVLECWASFCKNRRPAKKTRGRVADRRASLPQLTRT